MRQFIGVGQTGRARFSDGIWAPTEPPTLKDVAKLAGGGGDGSTLIFSHPKTPGYEYEMHEKPNGLGGTNLHLFSVRSGATAINPNGSQTKDAIAAEHDRNREINRRNKEFWNKQAGRKA